ncbi:MAG: patatin-like phospholipase family protein [bacterium]|nr:patatin-like phospholipase family protein [bacterium]
MEKKEVKALKTRKKRRAHLPKLPFANIAVSLSGGGFRATCIHLGLVSYLHSKYYFGQTLLERIRVLSTVSGGTFLGVKYVATLKKGGTFEDCYKSLVEFMTQKDLVEDALRYLAEDENWKNVRQRSLISAFASMYHRYFEDAHFGLLWDNHRPIHLKEISFNATEFHFALPFHFQKTEVSFSDGQHVPEFIGNRKIHIPIEMAKEVRLADIVAASSCVPFGFEPINFPDDFVHEESVKLADPALLPDSVLEGAKINYPIGLMDGGVDDNQGVDAVISAEERMKNYPEELKEFRSHDKKSLDLYIISDGTNPKMEGYSRSKRENIPYIGKWSFKTFEFFGVLNFGIGALAMSCAVFVEDKLLIIPMTVLGTLGILVSAFLLLASKGFVGLTRRLGVPAFFEERMQHVDKLQFGVINNLLVNRRNSAFKLITKVLIKQMRWFGFERVYGDSGWKPRLIMNAVFELTKEEVERRKKKYPYYSEEIADPGPAIMSVAAQAFRMGTTLWFTKDQLKGKNNMPTTIIACGQFTMCFNLLEYYEKFLRHPKYHKDFEKYSPELKEELEKLHASLLCDWKKFKVDPYWMVNECTSKLWPL